MGKIFSGHVIAGEGTGRTLGYPTANLNTPQDDIHLRTGVYAALATVDEKSYPAALVLRDDPWKVEVHILDIREDLYGKQVTIEAMQKVSELSLFQSHEKLIVKIEQDIAIIKQMFADKDEEWM